MASPTRSHGGSQHVGSQHGGSQRGGPPSGNAPAAVKGYPAPLGFDPAKSPKKSDEMTPTERINKRCELPADAYLDLRAHHTPFATRPGYSSAGGSINVSVNQFRVTKISNPDITQYDISLSPDPEHPAVYQKVWDSATFKKKLRDVGKPGPWLYDGRKLAWSNSEIKEVRVSVDLDMEKGRPTRPGSPPNVFLVSLKPTGRVRMDALKAYLEGKASWDNSVLECMSFLDHVLRQGPSERMKLIKRTFFNNASETFHLNQFTEAIKGIYSTIRLNDSLRQGGTGLGVNVDVSNQTFWIGQKFEQLVRNYLASINRKWGGSYPDVANALRPVQKANGFEQSEAFKALRKLHNIRFEVQHRGKMEGQKEYKVKKFTFDRVKGPMTARTTKFEKKLPDGKSVTVSIMEYYQKQYNARLQWPDLPLIETARAGMFPFEVCEVHRFNPYPFKLDPSQTQQMIKFAVQRPPQRKNEITKMVANLAWDQDRYLKAFGISISSSMSTIPAKLIKNPSVQFANRKVDPGTTGRWDLRGLKFLLGNKQPLNSWAFVTVDRCVDSNTAKNFVRQFKTIYSGHGGRIAKDPLFFEPPAGIDLGSVVAKVYGDTGGANKQAPQIVFFVVKDKSTPVYERLKKNADCRFAFPSQVLLASHVEKAQGQYCSNVSTKVNAKLGGQTSGLPEKYFKVPTMIIGADVSHAAPGSKQASMAAVCSSVDENAITYRAAVQTNGYRTEMITPSTIQSILPDMIKAYVTRTGKKPEHLFYFRDGVSEGQFAHVMNTEVEEFKKQFKDILGKAPKITVIVATKRHHIRFFPERGDKNGNALPGTLVEREVTHPFHYDFYLCSHVAIQGTARPVHYNVIHDEIKMTPDELQKMIYHQCYQYCRSTTPVSLHPAVYYAHLASNRARAHENVADSDKNPESTKGSQAGPKGAMAKHDTSTTSSSLKDTECPPLLPMGGPEARGPCIENIRSTMWWV